MNDYKKTQFLGFDSILNMLENGVPALNQSYPPHNIVEQRKDEYLISIALAGFDKSDINVLTEYNILTIDNLNQSQDSKDEIDCHDENYDEIDSVYPKYIKHGISDKSFQLRFALDKHLKVKSAVFKNGLLEILIKREIPEEDKPKTIKIK